MNLLFITPYVAPYRGVGALRMSSLIRYLKTCGERMTVVRIAPEVFDDSLKNEELEILGDQIRYIDISLSLDGTFGQLSSIFEAKLNEICKTEAFDCMICSCGPFYTLRAVSKIKKRYEIPYLLDYRDLWIEAPLCKNSGLEFLKNQYVRLRYGSIEKEAIRACDGFVTVTPICTKMMQDAYKKFSSKMYCIFNGYDDTALEGIQPEDIKDGAVNLISWGKFAYYSVEAAELFLKAVVKLNREGYRVRIIQIGEKEPIVNQLMDSLQITEDEFVSLGMMDYRTGISYLMAAHATILINDYGLGTKVFDYMFVNKPILIYSPGNPEYETILEGLQNKFFCQSEEDIYLSIKKIIECNITCLSRSYDMASFSRARQNKKYYELIKKVAETGKIL